MLGQRFSSSSSPARRFCVGVAACFARLWRLRWPLRRRVLCCSPCSACAFSYSLYSVGACYATCYMLRTHALLHTTQLAHAFAQRMCITQSWGM